MEDLIDLSEPSKPSNPSNTSVGPSQATISLLADAFGFNETGQVNMQGPDGML
jgi:hypothetical protein